MIYSDGFQSFTITNNTAMKNPDVHHFSDTPRYL